MGGALSFAAAQHVAALSCAAPCYGIPPSEYFQVCHVVWFALSFFVSGLDSLAEPACSLSLSF